ncbi:unnamed protein product [Protopolystoma xenopodis]|uniref:Uncharacterized protein n=1 Tax=Protopolystoma xenopodis TaxID=117903 RepID=A0A448WGR8_9PLAT|nr:unnamed protein product [Protopolystoma xenopodis]
MTIAIDRLTRALSRQAAANPTSRLQHNPLPVASSSASFVASTPTVACSSNAPNVGPLSQPSSMLLQPHLRTIYSAPNEADALESIIPPSTHNMKLGRPSCGANCTPAKDIFLPDFHSSSPGQRDTLRLYI